MSQISRGEVTVAFTCWYLAIREGLEKGADYLDVREWAEQYAGDRVGQDAMEFCRSVFEIPQLQRFLKMK